MEQTILKFSFCIIEADLSKFYIEISDRAMR